MTTRKDKAKVLDEVWTEERIRGFLELEPARGVDPDFHTLLRAYQQMRSDDFEIFIDLFIGRGRNINATNERGETLRTIVSQHRNSTDFVTILERAGG